MEAHELQKKITGLLRQAYQRSLVEDWDGAVRQLKAAEVLDKNNPEIVYNLGVCYCRMGLFKTAVGYFERLPSLPSAYVDVLIVKKLHAYALIRMQEYDKARALLDQVIKLSPGDVPARGMRGYCLEKQNLIPQAIAEYRDLLARDERDANACNSLAYILATHQGNLTEALGYAERAIRVDMKNPAYLDTLGYIHLRKGNAGEAEKFLKIALGFAPMSDEIRRHYLALKKLKK